MNKTPIHNNLVHSLQSFQHMILKQTALIYMAVHFAQLDINLWLYTLFPFQFHYNEIEYYKNGGILQYVLRNIL